MECMSSTPASLRRKIIVECLLNRQKNYDDAKREGAPRSELLLMAKDIRKYVWLYRKEVLVQPSHL